MSKGNIAITQLDPRTREEWIRHFIDFHTLNKSAAAPDDMRRSSFAFLQTLESHRDMHTHFYTGHEHKHGVIVPARTK